MNETKLPLVSILAPCRNEVNFIEETLMSILQNDYPFDCIEVLVIDGMSDDGTRDVVKKIAARDSRVKLLDNPQKIVPSAMNIGIKAACGEYIAKLDCHAVYSPDYISKCIELAERTDADNAGGYWATLPGADTPVAKAIAVASSTVFGVGNSLKRISGPERESDTAAVGTYKREVFKKVGLYDERFVRNQDLELNSRIRRAGGRIVISPEIKVSYYNRATYRGLWQQSFNNGLWNPYTIWLVGRGLSFWHFIPMFFVLGLIILTIATFFGWLFKWMLAGYILLYFSSAWFFASKLAYQKKISAFLIFWSFLVLHIGYGLGSIWGVITTPFKFPNRRKMATGKPLADRIA